MNRHDYRSRTWLPRIAAISLCMLNLAEGQQVTQVGSAGANTGLPVLELGPNYRICADPDSTGQLSQMSPNGTLQPGRTKGPHHRVEIGTGMNYYNPASGEYEPSQPGFSLSPDNSAFVASKVQHKVRLNGDIYTKGAVVVDFEGIELQSTPSAIGIYDAADGTSAIIATLTNSTGVQITSNQVLFADSFSGICGASVAYTIESGTFHQDIIFTGKLDPAWWGFSTNNPLRIQIYTEFYGAVPEPDVMVQPIYVEGNQTLRSAMKSPDLMDQTIGFGNLVIGTGRAYTMPTPDNPSGAGAVVAKEFFTTTDGRNFLVETVDFKFLQQLLSLPDCSTPPGSARVIRKRDIKSLLASIQQPVSRVADGKLLARTISGKSQFASRPAGVTIDYIANIGGTLTNTIIFAADTNYFVNGAVFCNGPTIFEPTIFKYPTNTAYLQLNNSVTCKSSMYRPVICTAVDDDSVGDSFTNWPGSNYKGSINPNGYANPAIYMNQTSLTLTNFRFSYAQQAIRYVSPSPSTPANLTVYHSQFVNCIRGIELDYSGTGIGTGTIAVNLNNSLIAGVPNPVMGGSPGNTISLALVHCTVDQATRLVGGTWQQPVSLSSTNSIYANITNSTTGVTLSGNNNGFFNSAQTFGTGQSVASSSPFYTIGAGNYYQSSGSPFLTGASTNLPISLLSDIQQRTVYPPTVAALSLITSDASLIQQAPRDIGLSLALGFHYPPLDYAYGMVTVSNSATLTVNPGTVIAGFAFPTNKSYALNFTTGAKLQSEGVPTNMVRFVSYNAVQEQATNGWAEPVNYGLITDSASSSAPGTYNLRFTDLSSPGKDVFLAQIAAAVANFQDCQMHGGSLSVFFATANLTNCLLERVYSDMQSFDGGTPVVINNTVYQGTFGFSPGVTNAIVKNNLFDQAAMKYSLSAYNGGNNAFVTNCSKFNCCLLYPTNASDKILASSPSYQSSWFGNYYLPSGSALIDAGNTTANLLGLYHYTTQTNQVKETNSVVDIGWHAVATDTNGVPVSTSGDGLPDWFADQNGNGSFDGGDIANWAVASTPLDSYNVPYVWYLLHNLYPLNSTTPTQDPDLDALSNYQEYRFGTDPTISQGVGLWVGTPNGIIGIP